MNNLQEELRARQQFDAWWVKQTEQLRMYWGSSRVAWAAWVAAQQQMKVETNLPEQLLDALRGLIPRIEQLRTNADEILEEFQALVGSGLGSHQRRVDFHAKRRKIFDQKNKTTPTPDHSGDPSSSNPLR